MIVRLSGAILAALMTALAAVAPANAQALELVPSVTVTDDVVRLGDIFRGVGDKAEIAVAYAPRYGRRQVMDANWLQEIARAHRLAWRPVSRFDRVMIERASRVLGREGIEARLLEALREQGLDGTVRLELDNRTVALHLPPDAAPTLMVKDLQLNPSSGRFSATVLAPAEAPVIDTAVHGRVISVVRIPVMARPVARDDVITDDDIEWIELDARRMQSDMITDAKQLIGQAPRRRIALGVPLRLADVRRPILIERGSMVTLMVRTPYMTLTARGKALENASEGDAIRVMNTQSNKTVEAVAFDAATVLVRPAAMMAAN